MKKCAEENDTPGESEPEKNATLGRTKIVSVNVGVSCLLSMVERVLQVGSCTGKCKRFENHNLLLRQNPLSA